jgi:hypothetical protein
VVSNRESLVEDSEVQEETHGGRDEVLERVLRQRERHRERSMFARGVIVIAGGAVGVFGGLLLIAPEFGLPLLLAGLRLLALEFDWAARAYARVAHLARGVRRRLRELSPRSRRGVVLTVVAVVALVVLPIGVALL